MSDEITVIIPVWDGYTSLLPECVASVASQRGTTVRIMVVDNASATDLPLLPTAVELLRLPDRRSVGAARNAALERVETDFVCFFDADDRMLAGMLAGLLTRLLERPDAIAAIAPFLAWDPASGETRHLARMPRPIVYHAHKYPRLFALSGLIFNSFLVAGGLYRTDAVRNAGGFDDGNLGEDWLLAAALAFRGRLEFASEPGFLHRTSQGSLWYREHRRAELDDVYRSLRLRIASDRGAPLWGRLAARAVRPIHALEVRRRTVDGVLFPRTAFER